ncbi:MAG: hypothetical protein IKR48_02475, partial [Kiritimatiellae bacterium]|nr:hypothetical protein [Kiritimatiellia bacterium]
MNRVHLFWATFVVLASIASATTYTWTGGAGDCLFSTAGNWDGNVAPTAATATDTLEFTVGGIASNDIANLTVGDITVTLASGAELTLGGQQKIGGSGTLTLGGDGTGRLVFDATGGLDAQPIVINAGVFKVGSSLTGSALGSAADTAPITVNAGGTFDVNYFDTTTVVDYPRSQVTHDKLIRIAGTGAPGTGGAIINSANKNPGNTKTIGDLVLLADATIGGSNRVDVIPLIDDNNVAYGTRATHASVSGDYVLTVADAGPTRARYKGLWNCTVNVKSITVTAGAELLFGNDVAFTLSDGVLNLIDGGKICTWGQNYHFQYPIVVTGSNNNIRSGSGTGYFDGALTVSDGAALSCSDGTVNFYGAVTGDVANTGAQLHFYTKVHGNTSGAAKGNTTFFHGGLDGIVTLKGNNSAAGQAVFYPDTSCFHGYFRTNGEGTIDGRTGEYVQKKNNIFAGAPMSLTVIGGITVNGQHNFGTYSDSISRVVLITNSTINVTEAFSAGRLGPREAGNHSIARLGDGTTVTAAYVLTGYNMWPNYGAIELLDGSVVNATNRVCAGYHWDQVTIPKCYGTTNANEWITVDGGTLNADGIGIGIGFRGPQSRFFLKNGTVNAKGFYFQAFRAKGAGVSGGGLCIGGTNTFRFVMSGGTLNLGAWGFESRGREDNSEANVILSGGTLNAVEDFSIPYWNPTLFGTWRGGSPDGFTLNTAGRTVTLRTALNGLGDVKLTGEGTVVGTNAMQGALGGRWTVDGGMTADLRGAASLLGGLSAGTNANVTLDVGAGRSAAFFSRDGSWPLGG